MAEPSELSFHWADYLVFGLTLALSSAIGVFYAYKDRRRATVQEYMMAGRKMPILPVTVSMFVSWCSAISFLSDPVEVYNYGALYTVIGLGYAAGVIPAAQFFAPHFHKLNIVSCNQYLNTRYNRSIQLLTSVLVTVTLLGYMAIAIFAPSLAFSQVSGIPVGLMIVVVGTVSTFYTSLGGIKAVLWADTAQLLVMISGLLAVAIRGCVQLGGIGEVWRIADEGGRINFYSFDPNPLARSTFWTYLVGGFFRVLNPYVSSQLITQRYVTVKTPSAARMAAYLNVPFYLLLCPTMTVIGLVMFAHFNGCDPLASGRINKPDQMVPLVMMELLSFLPGVPGIFLACIFSAALSSVSSAQTATVASLLKDMVEPAFLRIRGRPLSDRGTTLLAKCLTVVVGTVVVLLALPLLTTESPVFQLTIKYTGMVGGSAAGIFLLGFFCPFVDSLSAFLAMALSTAISVWMGIGSMFVPPRHTRLSVSVADCLNITNAIVFRNATQLTTTAPGPGSVLTTPDISDLYYWSPMLYAPLVTGLTVALGLIFGSITFERHIKKTDSAKQEERTDELEATPMKTSSI